MKKDIKKEIPQEEVETVEETAKEAAEAEEEKDTRNLFEKMAAIKVRDEMLKKAMERKKASIQQEEKPEDNVLPPFIFRTIERTIKIDLALVAATVGVVAFTAGCLLLLRKRK